MNDTYNQKAIETLKRASGKGMQYVLDTVALLLENPVNMFDISYNLLAYTPNKVDDDPLWNEIIELGTFSHKTVDFFNDEKFIEAYAKSDCVALMSSPKLKYDRANVIIFDDDGTQLGNICVLACYRPFCDNDFLLMQIISAFLSEEVKNSEFYAKMSRVCQESLVSKLIEGEENLELVNENAMSEIYSGLKENIYVAVIDTIQYESTLTHLVYFRNLFGDIRKDFKFFIYLNNIVAIMSTDQPFLSPKNDLKELNDFFVEYNIYAGVSDAFCDLSNLKKYFKQALNALNFGLNVNTGKNIFMYYDFRLEAFIKSYPDTIPMWRHPMINCICEYDKAHGTSYLETLYAFVLHGRKYPRTASVLGISTEQLSIVVNEIENLFEIDFSDINSLCCLLAYMKLHRCFPDKFED